MGQLLDEMVKNVNKQYKDEVMSFGSLEYNYEKIPFTSPKLNYATYGGVPKYKLTEFSGEEYSGKTTTLLDVIANYQHMGCPDGSVVFIDAENRLDKEWAEKIGVDVSSMYIIQPKGMSAEQIFQIIEDAVTTGECGLWALDSIGMLASDMELDPKKGYEDKVYGGISLPLTRFSKKIEQLMKKHRATGICTNQERAKMNSPYGGTDTPGGKAFKHACSLRISFRHGEFIDVKGSRVPNNAPNPAGNVVYFSILKITTAKPDRKTGNYTLNYDNGVNYLFDLTDVALQYGVINQRGSWFDIVDPGTGEIIEGKLQGLASVYSKLEENEELLTKIEELVDSFIKN